MRLQQVRPPSALASSLASTVSHRDAAALETSRACAGNARGKRVAAPNEQRVCGRGLRSDQPLRRRSGETVDLNPMRGSAEPRSRPPPASTAALEMEASCPPAPAALDSRRPRRILRQLRDAGGSSFGPIHPAKSPLPDGEDVAAVKRRRLFDRGERSIASRSATAVDAISPRRDGAPGRVMIAISGEHNRGVFDEDRVRIVRLDPGSRSIVEPHRLERAFVFRVLLLGAPEVDRLPFHVRELAGVDRRRNGLGQSDHGVGAGAISVSTFFAIAGNQRHVIRGAAGEDDEMKLPAVRQLDVRGVVADFARPAGFRPELRVRRAATRR